MSEPSAVRSNVWRGRLQRLRTQAPRIVLFVGGMGAALAALLLYHLLVPGLPPLTARDVHDSIAQAMASATPLPAFSAGVFHTIQPSFVLIQTDSAGANKSVEHGLGSGVIINDRGDILTSLHVVSGTTDIQLTFADGTESHAQVIAKQPENDIAVLQAARLPSELVPATLGNPNAMRVGDEAFVVGNPFGLYASMSTGVISGFNRSFRPVDSNQKLNNLIQIDAAVNPGNSGGPLLNRNGEVVGIVTGLVNPTEQHVFVGIGFAVPITVAGGAAGAPPY